MLILMVLLSHLLGATAAAGNGCCPLLGDGIAERYGITSITQRRFSHQDLWRALLPLHGVGGVGVTEIGQSIQGRAIRAVTFGHGSTRVLLWSQMHGDESTATMALADIIRYFAEGSDALRTTIQDRLTVTIVPMLNPDGAEVFRRHNAVAVDVNRDARRLATPEARVLKALRDSIQPQFGFNLHDQNARNTAGLGRKQVAIALLAPAADSARSFGPVRARARQLTAVLVQGLETVIPGRVAKYDDTFNPRAFGDLFQRWGTSTVLVESGALPDDPQKQELRRLNVRIVLTALEAIAADRYADADIDAYEALPFNESVSADLLVLGGSVVVPGHEPVRLDVALSYEDPVASAHLLLGEVGDLTGVSALDTLDATGLYLHVSTPSTLEPQWWLLSRGDRIAITIRRGTSETSSVVARIPE